MSPAGRIAVWIARKDEIAAEDRFEQSHIDFHRKVFMGYGLCGLMRVQVGYGGNILAGGFYVPLSARTCSSGLLQFVGASLVHFSTDHLLLTSSSELHLPNRDIHLFYRT